MHRSSLGTKKRRLGLGVALALFALCLPAIVDAQAGSRVVRIPDGTDRSRCVDPLNDAAWLSLRHLSTERRSGWFANDTSVVVYIETTVTARPSPGDSSLVYPLMSEVSFGEYKGQQVMLAVEYSVVDWLDLQQDATTYTGFTLELTLLNVRNRTPLGNALAALLDTGSRLPASPVGQATSYLLDFANSAVSRDIDDHDAQHKARSATLRLSFAPRGQCRGDGSDGFASTGTFAVIQSTGIQGDGLIPIGSVGQHCWKAATVYTFDLTAAPKREGIPCDDPSYEFRPVTNNYVGFILHALPANYESLETRERGVYAGEVYARCEVHRIPSNSCVPER